MTGPPAGLPTTPAGTGLRLCQAAHRVYGDASVLARHPALRPYLTDLAGQVGLAVREEVFGEGQSYTEMALPLVEEVTSAAGDEPVGLLVLAYGVHDVQPCRNIALQLASRCPGEPLAFAVTDQGSATAFAALRIIGDHLAGGRGRALLVVAEQAALHYPLVSPAPVPDRHAAAALLFESDVDAPVARVRQHRDVPAEAVGAVLAAEVAELAGGHGDVTLVAGPGLPPDADGLVREVRHAPPGLPYTGLWSCLDGPATRFVLADHDPTLDLLSVAACTARPTMPRLGDVSRQPTVAEQEEVCN